jgi:hypothetical protein
VAPNSPRAHANGILAYNAQASIIAANLPELSLTKWDLDPTWLTYEYTQLVGLLPRVRRRCASGGGRLARRGEIVTKAQKLRPALPCEPLPNHVLPLAHFGATSDVYDSGVWCGPMPIMVLAGAGERSGSTQHYDLKT